MLEAVISYEALRVIWWGLLGILLMGFALLDGFDLGAVVLLPFVAKTDEERRVVINTVAPVWEGNQVWLILGAGAVFAAFPYVYAVAFSGLYLPMFLVLSAFIFRPVAFKYRSKLEDSSWRRTWDIVLFFTGLIPLAGFGLVIGNIFLGLPFSFDDDMRLIYTGGFWDLLSPFPLMCAGLSVAMCVRHGAAYVALKTQSVVEQRSQTIFYQASWVYLALFIVVMLCLLIFSPEYQVTSPILTGATSCPINKTVSVTPGGWIMSYQKCYFLWFAPFLACFGGIMGLVFMIFQKKLFAFIGSVLSIMGTFFTIGLTLYPFLLPSSSHPNHSLTFWDASSSHLTLFVMLCATCIFLPIIATYTSFIYYVFSDPIGIGDIEKNSKELY